jgi:hypothetical protein
MSCKVDLIQNDLMRPGPIAAEKTMKEIDETISVLSAYTAALLALTNASDKDALTKAATSVNAAVAQAADVAKTLGAKDEDVALAKASSSVVMDMIGLVADTERYRVLKRYVLAVDPLMPTLSGEIGDALELIRGKRLPILAQRVTLEAVEYNAGSASRASTANGVLLATLLTQAASYNDLSSAKTADLVTKLAKTHHALADALRQDKGQMTTLFDAAKTLANDADQLEKAISSQAATGKPSK